MMQLADLLTVDLGYTGGGSGKSSCDLILARLEPEEFISWGSCRHPVCNCVDDLSDPAVDTRQLGFEHGPSARYDIDRRNTLFADIGAGLF